jgi:hypothetical protein
VETDILQDNPLLPEVGDQGFNPGSNLLLDWILAEVFAADPHVQAFRKQFAQCRRFYDGKHYKPEDAQYLRNLGRPDNAFNTAQKFVRYITGVERTAPEALLCNPIDENDQVQQQFGEFATRVYDWGISKGFGDFERSQSFEDLIVGGMGWEDYAIEYGRDPRGLPLCQRFSPMEALWQQTDRQNLEGGRWRARESYIDKDEARTRWPKDKNMINAVLRQPVANSRPEANGLIIYSIPNV